MTDDKASKSQLPAELRRVLPMLGLLFALLAIWLGWSGVQQWRDARLAADTEQARDSILASAEQSLATQLKTLSDRVASAPVQAAAKIGDNATVAAAIAEGWKDAGKVQVLPGELEAAYAAPAEFGFSKLALLEAALNENKAIARVVRDGNQSKLGLAAPVGTAVAYVPVPLPLLTGSFDQGGIPAQGYVALRQGGYTIRESGSAALAGGAEALARPVGKSGLRVVAATPDGIDGPMGLGAVSSLVVALLCGLLAVAALLVARGKVNFKLRSKGGIAADDGEPTLGQTLQREPLPSVASRANNEGSDNDVEAGIPNTSRPIEVDPGIFRAYDIRGVVGTTLSAEVAERIGEAIGSVMEDQGLVDIVV
ncbi:MAG: phosphomannomutase/phosphoglucomutase, partial [Burkholderiales bacterium]